MPGRNAFDMTMWAVWEDFTDQALRAARMIHGGVQLPAALADDGGRAVAIREHEWTHYRQHVSTGLGVFHHRLAVQRHWAVSEYYSLPAVTRNVPFLLLLADSEMDPQYRGWVAHWHGVDLLSRALWNANPPIGELVQTWNITSRLLRISETTWGQDKYCRDLASELPLDAPASPSEFLTGAEISEGLSTYREFAEVSRLFPDRDARDFMRWPMRGPAADALGYLEDKLGVGLAHPLVGALLDLAQSAFLDPVLCGLGSPLLWEQISPGRRLDAAIDRLASHRSLPGRVHDAFALASDAFRLDAPPATASHENGVARLIAEAWDTPPPADTQARQRQWRAQRFAAGLRLRSEDAEIFSRGLTPETPVDIRRQYSDVTLPPLLVRPNKVVFPRPEHAEDESLQDGFIMQAIASRAAHDLARDGEFSTLRTFMRTLPREYAESMMKFIARNFPGVALPAVDL